MKLPMLLWGGGQNHTFQVRGMHCPACEFLVGDEVGLDPGVASARASLAEGLLRVELRGEPVDQGALLVHWNGKLNPLGYRLYPENADIGRETRRETWAGLGWGAGFLTLFAALEASGLVNLLAPEGLGLLASVSSCFALVGASLGASADLQRILPTVAALVMAGLGLSLLGLGTRPEVRRPGHRRGRSDPRGPDLFAGHLARPGLGELAAGQGAGGEEPGHPPQGRRYRGPGVGGLPAVGCPASVGPAFLIRLDGMSRILYSLSMPEATLKNKLKTQRILANLTQEDLALKVGVTRQTVLAIEKGNYAPSVVLALRLAKTLGCTVEDLFDESVD